MEGRKNGEGIPERRIFIAPIQVREGEAELRVGGHGKKWLGVPEILGR